LEEQEMTSPNGRFERVWLRRNGWYIVIGLIVLYWVLKLFIFG
jgi:hypothetical protein